MATLTKTSAQGSRELKNWEENTYSEIPSGSKLTVAKASNVFRGDIEAEATVEYLMVYLPNGSASFIGLEQVTGRIGGRSGSFVLRHDGRFEGATASVNLSVVPFSGAGELSGLRGDGYYATQGMEASYTFEYYFE